MAMFHLLKIRTSIDIFKNEKCKVTFGLEYIFRLVYIVLNVRDVNKSENPSFVFLSIEGYVFLLSNETQMMITLPFHK